MEAIRWTLAHLFSTTSMYLAEYVLSFTSAKMENCLSFYSWILACLPCPPPPPPTLITTPTACLDLYGQCVGSSFFQKPPAELTFRFWFLHLLFMLPLHLRTPVSAPSCSSRNLEIAHDGGSQPSVSSLQITASAFKCHLSRHPPSPACQHFLSGLYHCLWTVSPLLFMLPRLPLHSTALKHGCHILLLLTNFDFCSFKTKNKILPSVWSGSCHSGLISYLPPSLTVFWPRACPVVQMCPVFCLVAAPCA